MPPRNPDAWARRISATAASTSTMIGTTATPARRSGLSLHSSASHRLWARAPASSSSAGRVAGGAEPGAERCRRPAGDRVGVGEDDLAGHAVGVELLVAPGGVPAAAQTLLVLLVPLLGELLVEEPAPSPAPPPAPARRGSRRTAPRYSGSSQSRYSGPGRPAWVSAEMTRYRSASASGSFIAGPPGRWASSGASIDSARARMVASVRSLAGQDPEPPVADPGDRLLRRRLRPACSRARCRRPAGGPRTTRWSCTASPAARRWPSGRAACSTTRAAPCAAPSGPGTAPTRRSRLPAARSCPYSTSVTVVTAAFVVA